MKDLESKNVRSFPGLKTILLMVGTPKFACPSSRRGKFPYALCILQWLFSTCFIFVSSDGDITSRTGVNHSNERGPHRNCHLISAGRHRTNRIWQSLAPTFIQLPALLQSQWCPQDYFWGRQSQFSSVLGGGQQPILKNVNTESHGTNENLGWG